MGTFILDALWGAPAYHQYSVSYWPEKLVGPNNSETPQTPFLSSTPNAQGMENH